MEVLHPQVLQVINDIMSNFGLPKLEYKSGTNDGEWYGRCPRCYQDDGDGGTDRFLAWPNDSKRPVMSYPGSLPCFMCRQCRRSNGRVWSGDLVEFVREIKGYSYAGACSYLHIAPRTNFYKPFAPQDRKKLPVAPSQTWQDPVQVLVEDWQQSLWLSENNGALQYLQQDRGFTDTTIKFMRYGYTGDYDEYISGDDFGLNGRICISSGISIPEFHYNVVTGEEEIWGVAIRRDDALVEEEFQRTGKREKYHFLRGSQRGLFLDFTLKAGRPCFMVEGQFDAASAYQEAGDLISVVATQGKNSSQNILNAMKLNTLASYVVIVKDVDGVSDGDMASYWLEELENVFIEMPPAHDVNSMLPKKGWIRKWVQDILLKYAKMGVGLKSSGVSSQNHVVGRFESKPTQISIVAPKTGIRAQGQNNASKNDTVEIAKVNSLGSKNNAINSGFDVRHQEEEKSPQISTVAPKKSIVDEPFDFGFQSNFRACKVCQKEGMYMDLKGDFYCMEDYPGDKGILLESLQDLQKWMDEHPYSEEDTQLMVRTMDLETTGLSPQKDKVVSIAIETAHGNIIIDARRYYDATQEEQTLWKMMIQMFFHPGVTWVGHNIKFDLSMMNVHFGVWFDIVYDTMLVEKIIHAGELVRHDMKSAALRYGLHVSKEERSWFIDLDKKIDDWKAPFPIEQRWYMIQDIIVPKLLFHAQQKIIEKNKLEEVVAIENNALPAIADMEVTGVYIDRDHWSQIARKISQKRQQLEEEIKSVLGEAINKERGYVQTSLFDGSVAVDLNLSSPQQLMKALQKMDIAVTSVKAEELEKFEHKHPIIQKLVEWKKLEKFLTSFGEGQFQYIHTDGRIHANFQQIGADTGRMSCYAPNLQQIPKSEDEEFDIRRCFIAPEGKILAVADLPNIELRILADYSGDELMLATFADENGDLHNDTARMMFNLRKDQNPKKEYINGVPVRQIAKTINFGLMYGMGPQGLARRVKIDLETAKKMMSIYFKSYHKVAAYLKFSGSRGVINRYAVSKSGRRKNFGHLNLEDQAVQAQVERQSKNHPIQGTNADILKVTLALLQKRLPEECHVVLVVHDEIVVEMPIHLQEEGKQVLASCMEEACRRFLKVVHIPSQEVKLSRFWLK